MLPKKFRRHRRPPRQAVYILSSFRSASLNSSILGCKLLRDEKDVLGNQEGSPKEVFLGATCGLNSGFMNGTGAYKVPTLIHLNYAGGSKRHSIYRRPLAARGALRAEVVKKKEDSKSEGLGQTGTHLLEWDSLGLSVGKVIRCSFATSLTCKI
jgi:hypothetical protein